MLIRELWNKVARRSPITFAVPDYWLKIRELLRPRKPDLPLQPITYGIHVFMRESGERLLWLEQRQRAAEERMLALEKRLDEMDSGQGQAVVAAKMEFETLIESWKTGLQNQIHRHDEMIGEIVETLNQVSQ